MPPPQQQIGPYLLHEELGRGGMGVVFRCVDVRTGEELALKVLSSHGTSSEAQLKRFERETAALAELQHPNLIRLRDAGHHRGVPYMVLDLVRGRDLQSRIDQGGPLLPWVAARILRKVGAAVQVAHSRGLVHRDIKPANVMLDDQNEPVLLDFGLVRSLSLSRSRLTKTGAFVGTPGYWSPEQAAEGALGPQSDVYSLGATLYAALTGQPPYTGASLLQILDAMQRPIVPPSEVASSAIDPDLDAIVMRSLETEPAERFPNGGAFAEALDMFLAGSRSSSTWTPRPRRRSVLPFALAGALAPLALGVIVVSTRDPGPPPDAVPASVESATPTAPPPDVVPQQDEDPPPPVISLRLADRHACELARRELLEGLEGLSQKEITAGPIFTYGPGAFPVFTARCDSPQVPMPLIAAAFHGEGRALAIGHDSYWADVASGNGWKESAETRRMLENGARWLSQGRSLEGLRVGVTAPCDLRLLFRELGCEVSTLSTQQPDLEGLQLVIMPSETAYPMPQESVSALVRFVAEGGGLFVSATGWGTQQIFEGRGPYDLRTDFPINQVLAPMGMAFSGKLYLRAHAAGRFLVARSRTENVHIGDLVEDLFSGAAMDGADRVNAVACVSEALMATGPSDPLLAPRVRALLEEARLPNAAEGMDRSDHHTRLGFVLLHRDWDTLPPEQVRASPHAAAFPGVVPRDAPRASTEVRVTPGSRWSSTGLYAAPGEVVTARSAEPASGWSLRIGCHTSDLWQESAWRRSPSISRAWPCMGSTLQVASPFGGLIYFEPPATGDAARPMTFTVEGAVRAPAFVAGETSESEWLSARERLAPWGELRGRRVAFSLPREVLRQVDDPAAILRLWDDLLDRRDGFAPPDDAQPDPVLRLVFDVQIHRAATSTWLGGFPSLALLPPVGEVPEVLRFDRRATVSDAYRLIAYHRMHSMFGWPPGLFATNELIAQWLYEQRNGGTAWEKAPWYEPTRAGCAQRWRLGAALQPEQQVQIVALFFAEVQQAFGWRPFREAMQAMVRPGLKADDARKRDLWITLLSRAAGVNLTERWRRYGGELSKDAETILRSLPMWKGPAD